MDLTRFLPSRGIVITITAFVLLGLLSFGASLSNGFVTWDDAGLIVENRSVQSITPETLKHVFTSYDPELYIPLTFVSYQLDHLIGGDGPWIYHATNLSLHILNALLVVWLLTLFLGAGWLSVALGLIFLLHPLNAEAVAWASARKDVLSTFFFLGALISYVRWRSGRRWLLFALSLSLFVLSLLSKVMTITLPVALILIDLLEQRRDFRRMALEKAPFFALSFVFGIIALFGKTTVLAASTGFQKVLMAGMSTVFYLEKFVIPHGLSFAYPYTRPVTLSSPDFFFPALIVVAFLWLTYRLAIRLPLAAFGLAFFLLTLIPTFANFSKGGDIYFASDRYAYVPMIGLLIAMGAALQHWISLAGTARASDARVRGIVAAFVLILIASGALAHAQSLTWRTSESLYRHALNYYPNSRAAHHNLGMELLQFGDPEGAIREFDTSAAIKDDPRTRVSKGAALVALKRYPEAMQEYETVIRTDPDEPDAYYGLGNIAYKLGDLQTAIKQYRQALAVKPNYTNALNNLGGIYLELRDWDNAIATLQRSVELRPDFPESYYNLAGAEERKGLFAQAEADYRTAIALSPSDADAIASLAKLVYDQRRIPEAADLLKQALRINQQNAIAHELLERMQKDGVIR